MADYQEIRDKMKEENCKRKEEERRNKPKLGLTEEQILTTICDYKRILDRVKDVADEIGFLTDEFDTLEPDKTEFYGDMVRITAYDTNRIRIHYGFIYFAAISNILVFVLQSLYSTRLPK